MIVGGPALAPLITAKTVTYSELFCDAGIPVKYFPDNEEIIKPVQYAALFTDLVKHTRYALKQLDIND